MLLSPHKIRWLFLVKGIIVPTCWLAMVIWAFVRVPPSTGLFSQHATLSGNQLSWGWLSALNSALGVYATLSVNIPDFTVRALYTLNASVLMFTCKALCQERAGVSNCRDPCMQTLIIFQPIHTATCHTRCIYPLQFCRYCRHKCRNPSLWRGPMEPPFNCRSLGQSCCSILRLSHVHDCHHRNQH